jgi:hypothetical protein
VGGSHHLQNRRLDIRPFHLFLLCHHVLHIHAAATVNVREVVSGSVLRVETLVEVGMSLALLLHCCCTVRAPAVEVLDATAEVSGRIGVAEAQSIR